MEERGMAVTNANAVADYILCKTRDAGDNLTNLKLQKLLYYAQAWYLAFYGEPLFDEPIEAWVHGPAQPRVYRRFKQYEWHPIAQEVCCPTFPGRKAQSVIGEVLQVYGDKTALQLEVLTHSEAPWRHARGGIPDHQSSRAVISHESMMDFYRSLLRG
jgi:uncharacterized phage-associated protein